MKIKNIISITTGLALAATITLPAFAQINKIPSDNRGGDQQERGWQGEGRSSIAPGHQPVRPGMGNWNGTSTRPMNRDWNATSTRPIMMKPIISGVVMSISGNIITINEHRGFGSTTATTTFTVDATNASVRKLNASSTITSIVVGDRISVQGTVNGTNIVATTIIDGQSFMMNILNNQDKNGDRGDRNGNDNSSSTPEKPAPRGFFGGMGQFFKHMFGF